MRRHKYYVVWKGRKTGIFDSWAACEAAVKGYADAEYKSFESRLEAERALAGSYADHKGKPVSSQRWLLAADKPFLPSVAVDAACRAVGAQAGLSERQLGLLAARGVAAGDRVVIHGGVYREAVVVAASGTAERPIVFEAAPGERVVVMGPTGAPTVTSDCQSCRASLRSWIIKRTA